MGLGFAELAIVLVVVALFGLWARRTAQTRQTSLLRVLAGVVLGLALAGLGVYHFLLNNRAKDQIAQSVLGTPFAKALPWTDRAAVEAKRLLEAGAIATTIRKITHPTGNSAQLTAISVRKMGESISVRIDVSWKGGFLGSENHTVVVWELSQAAHIRAVVADDSGAFGVAASNKAQLDEYFRDEVYPVLRSNLGD